MKKTVGIIGLAIVVIFGWSQVTLGQPNQAASQDIEEFRGLLQKLSTEPAGPCEVPTGTNQDTKTLETSLFERTSDIVAQELNAGPNGPSSSARDRAATALSRLERLSADINAGWPEENRFHFQILDLPPVLVIRLAIREHQGFFVFAVTRTASDQPNPSWHKVGSDTDTGDHEWPPSSVDLYPLHRGPSGNARFLAKLLYMGCAGSYGVAYDAREWGPSEFGRLDQVIKQEGSFGLDDAPEGSKPSAKHPFAPIGVLQTKGSVISLPYCWFSAIDAWDNPSMCAVDTYDVSGDRVRFVSRAHNRPDLLPIVKAIEYAEHRDYPAVLAYCGSSEVARTLVRDIPPYIFADIFRVTRVGDGKERVELGFPVAYRFEVERRNGRWLIVSFHVD